MRLQRLSQVASPRQQRRLHDQALRKKAVISCWQGHQECRVPKRERHMISPIGRSGHGAVPACKAEGETIRTTKVQSDRNDTPECR